VGYSGRYHAASLVAVFIALAIGILIGVGLADDVVSGADEELKDSLRSDLDAAETRADELETSLDREREFGSTIYPALVANKLAGSSVAIIGLGDVEEETAGDVEKALAPTGAEVTAKAVIAAPADPEALAEAAGPRYGPAKRGGAALTKLAEDIGSGIPGGSRLVDDVRTELFSRFSGQLDDVDMVVLLPTDLDDLEGAEREQTLAFYDGVMSGIDAEAVGTVAAERTGTDPTTVEEASKAGIATVDHADLLAGQVAIVFGLRGAEGDYGVKEGADSLLPDLVGPSTAP
jgi:hypothetical protein